MYFDELVLPDGTVLSTGPGLDRSILGCQLTQAVNQGTELTVGSLCPDLLEVTVLDRTGSLSLAPGTELAYRRVSGDGTAVQLGRFVCQEATRASAHSLRLTAYDRSCLLDRELASWLDSLTGWPYPLLDFARRVCAQCGLTLENESLPNGSYPVEKFPSQGVTGRMLLQWVGQLCARFCRATPSGSIEFAWYQPTSRTLSPTGSSCYFSCAQEDYRVAAIDKVQLRQTENDVGVIYPPSEQGTNTYVIQGNRLLSAASSDALQPVAQAIYTALSGIRYTPCRVSIPAGLEVGAGDILSVTDANGRSITTYVMTRKISGQRADLESTGSPSRDSVAAVNAFTLDTARGKLLEVDATVEGLRIANRDLEARTESLIQQTAQDITLEVGRTYATKEALSGSIGAEQTAEGERLTLQSQQYPPYPRQWTVYGKSEQFRTTGKNLAPIVEGMPGYPGNATFSTAPGRVEFNCTNNFSYNWDAFRPNIGIFPAGTYTLSATISSVGNPYVSLDVYKEVDGAIVHTGRRLVASGSSTVTLTEETTLFLYFHFSSNSQVSAGSEVVYENIQLELGSTATVYEPYTGGIPSPNPDYPQEIKSVGDGGSLALTAAGKNLFNKARSEWLPGYINHAGQIAGNASIGNHITIPVIPNTEYILRDTVGSFYFYYRSIRYLNKEKYLIGADTPSSNAIGHAQLNTPSDPIRRDYFTEATFTTPSNCYYVEVGTLVVDTTQLASMLDSIMLCLASEEDDTYEPYRGTASTLTTGLPLCGIPVSSGGNVTVDGQQYIADTLEVNADGTGKVVKRTLKFIVDGSADEGWYTHKGYFRAVELPNITAIPSCGLSTIGYISFSQGDSGNNGFCYAFGPRIYAYGKYDSLSAFEAWLQENPVMAIVPVITPTEIPLTAEEVQAVLAMDTYQPVTNLCNDAGAHMHLLYTSEQMAENDRQQAQDRAAEEAVGKTAADVDALARITSQLSESLDGLKTNSTASLAGLQVALDRLTAYVGVVEDAGGTVQTLTSTVHQTAAAVTTAFQSVSQRLDQSTEGWSAAITEISTYIRSSAQGVEIGKSDSPYKALLTNEALNFMENGNVVAYISNNKLHISRMEVLESANITDIEQRRTAGGRILWLYRG